MYFKNIHVTKNIMYFYYYHVLKFYTKLIIKITYISIKTIK